MTNVKFTAILTKIKIRSTLLTRNAVPQLCFISKYSSSDKSIKEIKRDEFDKPIKFSKTKAATTPAEHTRLRSSVFREENDIDEKIVGEMPPEAKEYFFGIKREEARRKSLKPLF